MIEVWCVVPFFEILLGFLAIASIAHFSECRGRVFFIPILVCLLTSLFIACSCLLFMKSEIDVEFNDNGCVESFQRTIEWDFPWKVFKDLFNEERYLIIEMSLPVEMKSGEKTFVRVLLLLDKWEKTAEDPQKFTEGLQGIEEFFHENVEWNKISSLEEGKIINLHDGQAIAAKILEVNVNPCIVVR